MEHPSLDAYLGALESEELLELARQLEVLSARPEWARYIEVLEVQRLKATHLMVHNPMRDVAAYAHSGGYIKGLEHSGSSIIEKVLKTARRVVEALESESEDQDG